MDNTLCILPLFTLKEENMVPLRSWTSKESSSIQPIIREMSALKVNSLTLFPWESRTTIFPPRRIYQAECCGDQKGCCPWWLNSVSSLGLKQRTPPLAWGQINQPS